MYWKTPEIPEVLTTVKSYFKGGAEKLSAVNKRLRARKKKSCKSSGKTGILYKRHYTDAVGLLKRRPKKMAELARVIQRTPPSMDGTGDTGGEGTKNRGTEEREKVRTFAKRFRGGKGGGEQMTKV